MTPGHSLGLGLSHGCGLWETPDHLPLTLNQSSTGEAFCRTPPGGSLIFLSSSMGWPLEKHTLCKSRWNNWKNSICMRAACRQHTMACLLTPSPVWLSDFLLFFPFYLSALFTQAGRRKNTLIKLLLGLYTCIHKCVLLHYTLWRRRKRKPYPNHRPFLLPFSSSFRPSSPSFYLTLPSPGQALGRQAWEP